MNHSIQAFAFAILAGLVQPAEAQIKVVGARTVVGSPAVPVTHGQKVVVKTPRLRRERNPYFAARPNYAPANNGARANITFEPYTRWYYPNENSYYPPLDSYPSIRSR
jgi:hypothetical protein